MKNKIATLIIKSAKVMQKQAQPPAMYRGNINYQYDDTPNTNNLLNQNSITANKPVPQLPANKNKFNSTRLTPISGNNPVNLNMQDKTHQALLQDMRSAAGLMGVKPQTPVGQPIRKELEPIYHTKGMMQGGYRMPPRQIPGKPHMTDQVYRVSYDPLEAQKAWDEHQQRSRFR